MKKKELIAYVKRMQKGEEDAFQVIVKEFYYPLYFMAYQLTNCEADAQDAVQETFIQISKSVRDLQEPKLFIMWAKKILFNKCKNIFRRNKDTIYDEETILSRQDEEYHREYLPQSNVHMRNDQEVIRQLMKELPQSQRDVLVLRFFQQMRLDEISELLGVPIGTVKSRLSTGKLTLRRHIQVYEHTYGVKLDFRSWTYLPLFYLFTARYQYLIHQIGKPLHFKSLAIGGAMVTTGIVVSSALFSFYEQENSHPQLPNSSIVSQVDIEAREAYFMLLQWAHCYDEMVLSSLEDARTASKYVNVLKKEKGPYYRLLIQIGWMNDYEAYLK